MTEKLNGGKIFEDLFEFYHNYKLGYVNKNEGNVLITLKKARNFTM